MYPSTLRTRGTHRPVSGRAVGMSRAPSTNRNRNRSQSRSPAGPEIVSYSATTVDAIDVTSGGGGAGCWAAVAVTHTTVSPTATMDFHLPPARAKVA